MELAAMEQSDDDDVETLKSEVEKSLRSDGEIYKASRPSKGSERLLPVHFMPEGKRCYDWITEDLKREEFKTDSDEKDRFSSNIRDSSHPIKDYELCSCQPFLLTSFIKEYNELCQSNAFEGISKGLYRNLVSQDICSQCGKHTVDEELLGSSLLCAAENGELSVVRIILTHFPLLKCYKDEDGYSALHRASYNGHLHVVSALLKHYFSDISSKTDDGWEPLHCACRWNQLAVVEFLVKNGANINSKTHGGLTPLHLASTSKDRNQILELLLLQKNIRTDLVNNSGETAFNIAFRSGLHHKLFEMADESLNSF